MARQYIAQVQTRPLPSPWPGRQTLDCSPSTSLGKYLSPSCSGRLDSDFDMLAEPSTPSKVLLSLCPVLLAIDIILLSIFLRRLLVLSAMNAVHCSSPTSQNVLVQKQFHVQFVLGITLTHSAQFNQSPPKCKSLIPSTLAQVKPRVTTAAKPGSKPPAKTTARKEAKPRAKAASKSVAKTAANPPAKHSNSSGNAATKPTFKAVTKKPAVKATVKAPGKALAKPACKKPAEVSAPTRTTRRGAYGQATPADRLAQVWPCSTLSPFGHACVLRLNALMFRSYTHTSRHGQPCPGSPVPVPRVTISAVHT